MKKGFILVATVLSFFVVDYLVSNVLKQGLDRYFGLDENAEILLIGHSHLMLAVDKVAVEDGLHCSVAKYCREGVGVEVRKVMLEHYLSLPHKDSLRTVVYGVDQYMFNPTGLSENAYKLFYPFMDNDWIDAFIRREASTKDYWMHRLVRTSRYSDALLNSSIRGWNNDWSNYKVGTVNAEALKNGNARKIAIDQKLREDFESSIKMLTDRGIKVVLINTPIVREYNDAQPKEYAQLIDYFKRLAAYSDLIEYADFNPQFSCHYELFYDPIHLNRKGQKVITDEVIKILASKENKNDKCHHSSIQ